MTKHDTNDDFPIKKQTDFHNYVEQPEGIGIPSGHSSDPMHNRSQTNTGHSFNVPKNSLVDWNFPNMWQCFHVYPQQGAMVGA